MVTLHYRPGAWIGAVHGSTMVFLASDSDENVIEEVWTLLNAKARPGDISAAILDRPDPLMSAMPDFVIIGIFEESLSSARGVAGKGAQVLVRGSAEVHAGSALGTQIIGGWQGDSWQESWVEDVSRLQLKFPASHPFADQISGSAPWLGGRTQPWLPLTSGVAPMDEVLIDVEPIAGSSQQYDAGTYAAPGVQPASLIDLPGMVENFGITTVAPIPTGGGGSLSWSHDLHDSSTPTTAVPISNLGSSLSFDSGLAAGLSQDFHDDSGQLGRADLGATPLGGPSQLQMNKPQSGGADAPPPAMVPTLLCSQGHPNPPHGSQCQVCGGALGLDVIPMPRPSLGIIRFTSGAIVELVNSVVIGRSPRPVRSGPLPILIPVPDAGHDISRNHVEVQLEGWHVLATDLNSVNGSMLFRIGQDPVTIVPMVPVVLIDGDVLDLGSGVAIRYESSIS